MNFCDTLTLFIPSMTIFGCTLNRNFFISPTNSGKGIVIASFLILNTISKSHLHTTINHYPGEGGEGGLQSCLLLISSNATLKACLALRLTLPLKYPCNFPLRGLPTLFPTANTTLGNESTRILSYTASSD